MSYGVALPPDACDGLPGWDRVLADRALALSRALLALPESEQAARRSTVLEAECNTQSTRGEVCRVYRLNPGEKPAISLFIFTPEPEPPPDLYNGPLFLFRMEDAPGQLAAVLLTAGRESEELAELEAGGGRVFIPGARIVREGGAE